MLKLASPELERLIIAQQNGMVTTTPTPSGAMPSYMYNNNHKEEDVTEAQEQYARGFVDALKQLHEQDRGQSGSDSSQDLTIADVPTNGNLDHNGNTRNQNRDNNRVVITCYGNSTTTSVPSPSMITVQTTNASCNSMNAIPHDTYVPNSASLNNNNHNGNTNHNGIRSNGDILVNHFPEFNNKGSNGKLIKVLIGNYHFKS